jgi:hypothetical protein
VDLLRDIKTMMENVFTATKISSNPSSEILHREKSIQNTINSFLGGKVLVYFTRI